MYLWKVEVDPEPDRAELDEGLGGVVLLGVDGQRNGGGRLVPVEPAVNNALYKFVLSFLTVQNFTMYTVRNCTDNSILNIYSFVHCESKRLYEFVK